MKPIRGSLIAISLLWFAAGAVFAEEQEENVRHCLAMSQIDHIQVVDDRTLIFHMRGGKKYINKLPYRCSGLKNNSFLHETSLPNYCDLDTISVLNTSTGMRLGSCPLGKFESYVELDNPDKK